MTPEQLAEIERLSALLPQDDDVLRLPEEEPAKPPRKRARKPKELHGVATVEKLVVKAGSVPVTAPRMSWPFATMQLGDWFAVRDLNNFQKARVAASAYARRNGVKFQTKTDATGALIVTRTA